MSTRSVSYTHLDVYKRQVHVLAVLPLPHALLICTSETLRYFDCSGVGKQYRTVTGQDSGGQILMLSLIHI